MTTLHDIIMDMLEEVHGTKKVTKVEKPLYEPGTPIVPGPDGWIKKCRLRRNAIVAITPPRPKKVKVCPGAPLKKR